MYMVRCVGYMKILCCLDTWDFGVSGDRDKPKSECPVKGIKVLMGLLIVSCCFKAFISVLSSFIFKASSIVLLVRFQVWRVGS